MWAFGIALASAADAYEVNDHLSARATVTGVFQYGVFDDTEDEKDGTVVIDAGLNFRPTDHDEFQLTASFAPNNGLNDDTPFSLSTYADDLEDALQDINGRDRDYLLEAWYKRNAVLSQSTTVGVTAGIIDATAYIDGNRFANDEVSQFMNDIFVNNTLANLPSYDLGGVIQLDRGPAALSALFMNTKNEGGRRFNYYAAQLAYEAGSALGAGIYRVYGFLTSEDFAEPSGGVRDRLRGLGLSLDQDLTRHVGVFARAGWQDDQAVVDHEALLSLGISVAPYFWGRPRDRLGFAWSYLEGADSGAIDSTVVLEGFAKIVLSERSDISFDVQYVKDDRNTRADRQGAVFGVRVNLHF